MSYSRPITRLADLKPCRFSHGSSGHFFIIEGDVCCLHPRDINISNSMLCVLVMRLFKFPGKVSIPSLFLFTHELKTKAPLSFVSDP